MTRRTVQANRHSFGEVGDGASNRTASDTLKVRVLERTSWHHEFIRVYTSHTTSQQRKVKPRQSLQFLLAHTNFNSMLLR